jgi:hypothetical protein
MVPLPFWIVFWELPVFAVSSFAGPLQSVPDNPKKPDSENFSKVG